MVTPYAPFNEWLASQFWPLAKALGGLCILGQA